MHLSDGELRAYQDHALSEPGAERARAHLAACARCRKGRPIGHAGKSGGEAAGYPRTWLQ